MSHISSYIEYFKKIASEHKQILHSATEKHFFMMDINEFTGDIPYSARYPALLLLQLSGRFVDDNRDNALNELTGGFMVVDHCKKLNDYAREMEIMDESFRIGNEIIARINHDVLKCEALALKAVPGFETSKVGWEQYGPVFTNHFGTLFKFPVIKSLELDYDESKWL